MLLLWGANRVIQPRFLKEVSMGSMRRLNHSCVALLVALAACIMPAQELGAQYAGSRAGWELQALESADLDAIAQSLGVRAGVMIAALIPGSPAARAGCIQGEVICAFGNVLVDSPSAISRLEASASGRVEIVGFVLGADGGLQVVKRGIEFGNPVASGSGGPALPAPATGARSTPASGLLPGQSGAYGQSGTASPATGMAVSPHVSTNDLSRGGSVWRHPAGFSFWHPASFEVKEADGGIQLIPVSRGTTPDSGQLEMYFITAESISGTGISSPFDPRVLPYLDNLVVSRISPAMKRNAQPGRVPMAGGEGLYAEWTAPGQGGSTIATRIYATVLQSYGVYLISIGERAKLDSKSEELTAVLRSIAIGEGKLDRTIAGAWKLYSTRQLRNNDTFNFTVDDARRADMVSDEQTVLELAQDGSARRTSMWRTIARGGVSGGSSTVWLDSGDQKTVKQGRWNADSGTLFILWQDGGMDQWQYSVSGSTLRLITSGRVQFWQR